ncbi:MAG TPA: hypothetical protein DD671_00985 [Balneolaceae bacterium]|nr:hypothetical protein [Balneola sp.]HBQ58230.1 hypothetical protein [Balneolaceae bacterium]|tara:strand:+ start:162 stop:380 length:219 start_codon:yes stop_codon:yes gene_type:complete
MDIQTTKIELAKLILELESPDLVKKIQDLILSEENEFKHQLTSAEKEEIEIGLEQLNRGERTSLDDFLKKVS